VARIADLRVWPISAAALKESMVWRRTIMPRFIATIQLPNPDFQTVYSQKRNTTKAQFENTKRIQVKNIVERFIMPLITTACSQGNCNAIFYQFYDWHVF
jgi:predicted secreted protein